MILVVGQTGQVAREIARIAQGCAGSAEAEMVQGAPSGVARSAHELHGAGYALQTTPDALSAPTSEPGSGLQVRFLSRADADLSDPHAAAAALSAALKETGAEAVINAAAYTAVDKAEEEPELARTINATAPGALAEVCAAHGVPFVHISTDYVFDGSGDTPRGPDAATAPLGVYAATKLEGEAAVAAAGCAYAVVRTSWVFSAHGANFVKTMLRLSESRQTLSIVADQIGGPTPAAAVARTCVAITAQLRDDPSRSGVYHYSGAPDVSWAGFARAIFAAAGRDIAVTEIPTSSYPTPATRPLNSRLDCSATERVFGLLRPDWRAALPGVLTALGKGTA